MTDGLQVNNGDIFTLVMEKFNSKWKQGVCLETNGAFFVNNKKIKKIIVLWQDTAPEIVEFGLSLKKPEILYVKNIWDTGDGTIDSGHNGAGMTIEEVPNGKRYFCNDGYPDDNFDDIVFTLKRGAML